MQMGQEILHASFVVQVLSFILSSRITRYYQVGNVKQTPLLVKNKETIGCPPYVHEFVLQVSVKPSG